jgi:zinc finger SWIM domain-containing protein 3
MKCLTCNREEKSRKRFVTQPVPKYQYTKLRVGCKAHMKINICSKGIYKITSFEPQHNHTTTSPTKIKMLKSHKKKNKAQQVMGDLTDAAGIRPKKHMSF